MSRAATGSSDRGEIFANIREKLLERRRLDAAATPDHHDFRRADRPRPGKLGHLAAIDRGGDR